MINKDDLKPLINAAILANFNVDYKSIQLEIWEAGIETHVPRNLPDEFAAVYIFKWNDRYLKVGKVNSNSNARYKSQHYNPNSSKSNLSKSLINHPEFQELIGEIPPEIWIKENTTRYNILIPTSLNCKFVTFAEAFFILKCNPIFEDGRV
jgi:hypothetical protein